MLYSFSCIERLFLCHGWNDEWIASSSSDARFYPLTIEKYLSQCKYAFYLAFAPYRSGGESDRS